MRCSGCGLAVARGKFCQECGSALATAPKFCGVCGTPGSAGKSCSNCGSELTQPKSVAASANFQKSAQREVSSTSRFVWITVGTLASVAWLIYMGTPVWGGANPWAILAFRESQFGGDSDGILLSYQAGVVMTSTMMLGVAALGFYLGARRR